MRYTVLCCALLILTGCGPRRETYTVIHGAWLSDDGRSIVVLAETGEAKLSVSSFAAVWNHDSDTLTVWRLDRRTHELRQLATRPTPADFTAYYGPVTPGQWRLMADASGTIAGTPLPDCAGALTRCAVRRTPEPFTVRERRIIDPTEGVTLLGLGRKVVIEPWSMQTPVLVERARGESVAALAARVRSGARECRRDARENRRDTLGASATLLDAACGQRNRENHRGVRRGTRWTGNGAADLRRRSAAVAALEAVGRAWPGWVAGGLRVRSGAGGYGAGSRLPLQASARSPELAHLRVAAAAKAV